MEKEGGVEKNWVDATESEVHRLFRKARCLVFALDMYGNFVRGVVFMTRFENKSYYSKFMIPDRKLPANQEDQIHFLARELNRIYKGPPSRCAGADL